MLRVKREGSCLGQWMSRLETRAARNVVIVATANKLARISWAVLSSGNDFRPMHPSVSCSARQCDLKFVFQKSAEERMDENTVKRRA